MRARIPLPILSAAVLLLGLSGVTAARGPDAPPERGQRMIGHFVERLDLSEAQAEELAEIMREHRDSMAPAMDDLRRAQRALREQVAGEIFDESAIRDRAAAVAALEADLAVNRARHFQTIRGILTPEQFEEFQAMHQRRLNGPQGPWGPGHHGGGRGPRR